MAEISIAEATARLTAPGAPFEMEEAVIRGVKMRVWKNAPPNLRMVFEATLAYGDRTYLVYEDDRMTYEQHYHAVSKLASLLVNEYGVDRGDRIAIAMRNFPEWAVCFWAGIVTGAIVVPLNAWWTGSELEYGLADSGANVLFADQQRAHSLEPHYANLELNKVVVARAQGRLPGLAVRYEDELALVDGTPPLPEVMLEPEDDATIFYTSGTTGEPTAISAPISSASALAARAPPCANQAICLSLRLSRRRKWHRSCRYLSSTPQAAIRRWWPIPRRATSW